MQRQPLTTGQVAKYCGVNFRTVIRWIERGQLQAFKLPGRGDNRIEVPRFLEFLRTHDMPIPGDLAAIPDRALIVDGDAAAARTIDGVLQDRGFETRTAEDGFRAGLLLGTFAPGVVTLDVQSPGIDGVAVLRYLRTVEQFKGIKVLVVSDLPAAQLDGTVKAGADDVLGKPFNAEQLSEKLQVLLDNGR